jgi:SAM-dependent methyltransferase
VTTLQVLKQDWDHLAKDDPFWAICTDPRKRRGAWDLKEFFATGENEVGTVLQYLFSLKINVDFAAPALDFGCGVGRLTQALAKRFAECTGVDISPTMIQWAEKLNQHGGQCKYFMNDSEQLAGLPDNYFGFVYSSIVLQHIRARYISCYLREFVRVLRPGGILVFQLPAARRVWLGGIRGRLQLRSRFERWRSHLPFSEENQRSHMEMNCVPESQVQRILLPTCRVVDVTVTNSCQSDFNGHLVYSREGPSSGVVSHQYIAIKS